MSAPRERSGGGPLAAALAVGAAYVLVYLYSLQQLVVTPGAEAVLGARVPSVSVVADWPAKMWKPIAPFVWEPVVALHPHRSIAILLSLPNLGLGLLLGALVGLNAGVAVARLRAARARGRRAGTARGVVAAAPGLLTGFTCCVPTAVLALGSLGAAFTVAAIALQPYLIPAAALALAANLVWGVRRLRCELPAPGAAEHRTT